MTDNNTDSDTSKSRIYGVSRRSVLRGAGAAGLFSTVPWSIGRASAIEEPEPPEGPDFTGHKFVDELPRPGVLEPSGRNGRALHYDITLTQFEQTVLPEDMGLETKVWGYNGSFPGPTIEARPRQPVEVNYDIDELPTDHLLGVDTYVHGAEPENPEVRIATHLHGGVVRPEDDGYPEAWASPETDDDGNKIVNEGSAVPYKQVKEYPNDQKPGTMWYHDHALGITRLNVYAGLAGFYLLRDPLESRLPNGDYEIPIVIQDRTFDADGELFYPPPGPPYEAEYAADIPVVNGKAYPKLTVEPRRYRLRFLNGSNGRTFNLRLYNEETDSYTDVPSAEQIGVDLGFLESPVSIGQGTEIDNLLLSGAERADLIVDFSGFEGQTFTLKNNAEFPYTGENSGPDIESIGDIMQIEVGHTVTEEEGPTMPLDQFLNAIDRKYPEPEVEETDITRTHTLTSAAVDVGASEPYDTHFLNLAFWHEEDAAVNPQLGTSEVWEFLNLTGDSHPIHIHLVDFDVIERQGFTWGGPAGGEDEYNAAVEAYVNDAGPEPDFNDYLSIDGTPTEPLPNNAHSKDTVLVNPGEVVRVRPSFTGFKGRYVWHCHILEHEDQEMMLPYDVE